MAKKNYPDLPRTGFPDQIDSRPGTTNGNVKYFENSDFSINVNFSDRDGFTNSVNYYVMADDINALQDATIAIQRSLGQQPQGNVADNVADRFLNLEAYVKYHDSMAKSWPTTDHRYMWGNSIWPKIDGKDVPLVSIIGHRHNGIAGQASKIHLVEDVTDKLRKGNMDLNSSTTHMLSAQDIRMSTSTQSTIAQHFETKYDKAGGTISGDVKILGRLVTRAFIEIDAFETLMDSGKEYTLITNDYAADSGRARVAPIGYKEGFLVKQDLALRFGDYSIGVRIKIPTQSAGANKVVVCRLLVQNTVSSKLDEEIVRVEDLKGNEYSMVHMKYKHGNHTNSSAGNQPLKFSIKVGSSGIPVSIDSIVVSPLHIAVYDEDM